MNIYIVIVLIQCSKLITIEDISPIPLDLLCVCLLWCIGIPTPLVPSRGRCHTLPEGQESAESAVSGRGRNDTINCRFQDSGGVRSYRLIILAVLADNAAIVRPALDIHVEYQGHFQAQSWNRVAPSAPHFLYSFRTFPLVTKSFRKMPSGGFDPRIPPLLFAVCSVLVGFSSDICFSSGLV